MYTHCIFCSADLLRNETIEEFPIGSRLAFDAFKGRLWAVCPRCARWNLAPIETRWEAVESAEKLFRDARVRVHSENIGIAHLPDGTRMIRIGEALPLETAAWRYGDHAVRRQRRMWLGAGGSVVGASALAVGGIPLLAAAGAPVFVAGIGVQIVANYWLLRSQLRPVYRVPADLSPNGQEVILRHAHAAFCRVVPDDSEHGFAMEVPLPLPPRREEKDGVVRWTPLPPLRVQGGEAERMLERVLVGANPRGFGRRRLRAAVERLSAAGEPRRLFRELARQEAGVFPAWMAHNTNRNTPPDLRGGMQRFIGTFRGERIAGAPTPGPKRVLPRADVLALEMALHEETERRALAGELRMLEAAWREADEIATIADALPDDPAPALAPPAG
ncbi:MAG TPA: hypothetical protein VHG09_08695 [Longimicrobiales bacterium]|nr:hypothetical protein [Longimicrobiales bacterium]